MNLQLFLLLIVVVTALAFDFTNGFHDTGNAMATSIASGALAPRVAVALSAVLNLIGAFLSTAVAATIAKGLIDANLVTLELVFAGLVGGIVWNLLTCAKRFPFERYRRLCDVGCADGLLSRIVAAAHPHLQCVSFDLPAVTEIARRKLTAEGLGERVQACAGDFLADPLPAADVITMGQILHDWNLDRKQQLVAKAYEALSKEGAFIVIETLIDDARRENTTGLMMSLNMLIEFGDAFDYSAADFRGWCGEAGFRSFEVIPLAGGSSAAVAYK